VCPKVLHLDTESDLWQARSSLVVTDTSGADIAMLVGLPVSAGVYLIACRSLNLEKERRRAAAADLGLDPDDPVT